MKFVPGSLQLSTQYAWVDWAYKRTEPIKIKTMITNQDKDNDQGARERINNLHDHQSMLFPKGSYIYF